MEFLHYDVNAGADDVIVVSLDQQANVLLLDETNYSAYRTGRSFHYRGGWQKQSPAHLSPPHYGRWHVVVDLAGHAGTVRVGVNVVRQQQVFC